MNLSNESIEEFGISQSSLDVSTDLTSSGAVNIISKSGSNTIHGSGFVQINVTGLGGFVYGPNANAPQATYQQNRQVKYDASWIHGKHTVQFGIAYNRIDEAGFASFFGLGPRLRASFAAGVADVPFNGNGDTDPLNYQFNSAFIGNGLGFGSEKPVLGLPAGGFINNRLGVYLHDTWRATRTLTLNGGLRYDLDTGLTNRDLPRAPGIGAFDPELGLTPRNDNFRLGPQAGFAWNINGDGKTIIRGGGGIYYETNIFNNILFDRTVNLPPGLGNATPLVGVGGSAFLISPIDGSSIFDPTTDCIGVQPGTSTPNSCIGASLGAAIPFVVAAENTYIAQSASLAAHWPPPGAPPQFNIDKGVVSGSILDPHYKSPYSAQINIGMQRQIKPGLVLSLDYIMNRGVHFNMAVDRNRIGAANTLNIGLAESAIATTLSKCHAATIDAALVSCAANKNAAPATINNFANNGLEGDCPGFDGCAFGGNNINFRQMSVLEPVGVSRYQALQAQLSGRLGSWGVFRNVTTNVAYALSRFNSSAVDQDFLSASINNDVPTQYYGPAGEDRLHQLGVSLIMDLPAHFKFATTTYFRSNGPSNVFLSANGTAADIFTSDLNGDGTVGDPLPGTSRGSFDRDFGVAGLNKLIAKYDANFAGALTPAGQALVDAGLFSPDQLVQLGAVAQSVDQVPANQKDNPLFYTTDVRLSWVWKVRERLSIEPTVDCFNIFNKTNTQGPLDGTLSGAPGTISGTTAYFTRVGAGSGSFSSGQPRAFQFGIRVSF